MATGGGVKEVGVRLKVGATGTEAVDQLGASLRRLGTNTAELDAKAEALGAELATAQDASTKLAQSQDKLAPATREATKAADGLAAAAKQGGEDLNALGGGSEVARQKLGAMKLELAAAGGAAYTIGRALGSAAKDASAFETAMAEVGTLVQDTSGMTAQAQAVRTLAREYGGDAPGQARALYQIISAGAKEGAEATAILDQANKLAVGGVTSITVAADGLTSVLNAYGREAGTAQEVSDALFVAMKGGKTTVGELSGAIGQVAPIAAQAGVGLDQLLAATAALTKGGTSTGESMTQLRGIVSAIIKPSGEAQEMASALGLAFDAQALKAKGLAGFLEEVRAKTGGNTEVMAKLFGGVEALGGVLALTGSQAGSFRDVLQAMQTRAGATDEAFAKMAQTSGFAGKQFQAALDDARISMGQTLTALTPLLQAVTSALNLFNELPEPIRTAAAGVVGLGLVVGPMALAVRSLANAVGLAATAIGVESAAAAASVVPMTAAAGATGLLTKAATGVGAALRLLAGPIGLALSAVASLVPEFLRAKKAAEDGDEAVRKMLRGPDKSELPAKAKEAAAATDKAGSAATSAAEKYQGLEAAARVAASQLGVDLAAATNKVTLEFTKSRENLDKLVAGLPQLRAAGVDTGRVVADALSKMASQAKNQAEFDALRERILALGDAGVLSKTKVVDLLEAVRLGAKKAKDAVSDLAGAYTTLGVKSQADLKEAADKFGEAWEKIRNDATASLATQIQAFSKFREAAIAANGGVESSAIALQRRMLETQARAKGLGDEVVNGMRRGRSATDELTDAQMRLGAAMEDTRGKAASGIGTGGVRDTRDADGRTPAELERLRGQGGPVDASFNFAVRDRLARGDNFSADEIPALLNALRTTRENINASANGVGGLYDTATQRDDRMWEEIFRRALERAQGRALVGGAGEPAVVGPSGAQGLAPVAARTVNINLNGRTTSVATASEADAEALTQMLQQLGEAARRSGP